MVKEGSEVRAELKSLLEKMFLGGLVLWKSHTEEHREGGKLNILDKWQSVKAAVLHADDDESESVHGMKKMRSLKNPSEGQNSANFRMMWARNKTSTCKSCLQQSQPINNAFPVRFTKQQRMTARQLANENWETWRSQRRRVEAVQARRAATKHADRMRIREERRLREEAVQVLYLRGVFHAYAVMP